jgi:predicted ester cyclase
VAVMRNTEIFEQAMAEVFGHGNLGAVEQFFGPDFQEHEEGPGKDRGRDGLKDIVRTIRGAFPDLQVTVEAISEDGDQTWARVTFRGTNTGELMGHPPTGRTATWTAIDQCRYADGKLAEHWGVVDLLSMMQQIGIIPPPQQV